MASEALTGLVIAYGYSAAICRHAYIFTPRIGNAFPAIYWDPDSACTGRIAASLEHLPRLFAGDPDDWHGPELG